MIFLREPVINAEKLAKYISGHEQQVSRFKKLNDYYKNEHDIKNRASEGDINNKIANDFCGYIVDTIVGYFIGKPIRYTSNDASSSVYDKLMEIFSQNNEQDHNAEIAKTMSIQGLAYELLYMDEDANIRFTEIPPEEIIPLFKPDFNKTLTAAIRIYTIDEKDYADIYYSDRIETWIKSGSGYIMIESRPHPFGKVPLVYYWNNKETMGDFEKIMTLVDAYDKRISDNSDEMDRTDEAYLVLTDMSGSEDEDIDEAKKRKVFKVENGGKVSYLTKDINDTFIQNNLKTLEKNIHKFSKVPNLSDESFAGNLSGVAIEYKLWGLEQLAATKERKFKTAIQRRIKLILNVLHVKGHDLASSDVKISFVRNMPKNLAEIVQMILQLKSTLPEEFLLSLLPFVDNPKEMLELLEKEMTERISKSAAMDYPMLDETGDPDE